MKIFTTNPTCFLGRCTLFIGAMLIVTLLMETHGSIAAGPAAVNLGSAAKFALLSKSGISTTGTTSIVGNIGVSPAAATSITGFGLIADASNTFSTSSLVTEKIYAADYTPPTPTIMTTAISDMEIAYTDAAGRTSPDSTELGAGNISGMTLTPGLYKWGTGLLINNTGITLSGGADAIWIFQIAGTLTLESGAIVTLSGGAKAENIFWQVAGQTTLRTTVQFKGNILCLTSIVLNNGAALSGRALAQTAITLDANPVTGPAEASTAVPIELVSFTYNIISENTIELNWSTASETNNFGFEIERSINGEEFEKIGFVNGYGNSLIARNYKYVDSEINSGKYYYRLKQIDFDGTYEYSNAVKTRISAPEMFKLSQNYPNPFNPETEIKYQLLEASSVNIKVYNIMGQEIKTLFSDHQSAGYYSIKWDGTNNMGMKVASGTYIYKIEAGSFIDVKKMIFLQ